MVKIKYLLIAALVVIVGILLARRFFQSEETKVKKEFHLASKWFSKEAGETALAMAHKTISLRSLFAEEFHLKAHLASLSGTYTPQEILSLAVEAHSQFSEMSLKFYDLHVDFPEDGIARVVLTARLWGNMTDGEYFDETHELQCRLKKTDKKWLFTDCEVIEVLKK